MRHFGRLTALAATGLAAAASAAPPSDEALADTVLRQLRLEAEYIHVSRSADGAASLLIETRPRATDRRGLCVNDALSIDLLRPDDPAEGRPAEPARIRRIGVKTYYEVLLDADRKPRWDVGGDALARACTDRHRHGQGFEAESSAEAELAVKSLTEAVTQLRSGGPAKIRIVCGRIAFCPTRAEAAASIDTIDPRLRHTDEARCGRKLACVTVAFQSGPGLCDVWSVSVGSEWSDPRRVRTIAIRYGGLVFECEKFPEPDRP
jgi:hypothetical protein